MPFLKAARASPGHFYWLLPVLITGFAVYTIGSLEAVVVAKLATLCFLVY